MKRTYELTWKPSSAESDVCLGRGFQGHFYLSASTFVAGRGIPSRARNWALVLALGNELSEERHVLTKQEVLLGKGTRVESRRVGEPRSTALPHGSQSWVLW